MDPPVPVLLVSMGHEKMIPIFPVYCSTVVCSSKQTKILSSNLIHGLHTTLIPVVSQPVMQSFHEMDYFDQH
ncbi:unnamed protein product [Sphenostylis stenocarpa]|uniref:Uncharacterized protein n=1 Tax=Sphenostylis stenocarpa TaxID=92480 RepID=A0AA86VHT3_9FABA|nr:unnamed protein product [Sphenostylis stenocarpa]